MCLGRRRPFRILLDQIYCTFCHGSEGDILVDNLQEPALWVTLRFSELLAIRYHLYESISLRRVTKYCLGLHVRCHPILPTPLLRSDRENGA